MSMAYYLETCGRTDIQIVPLYDAHYAPRDGDLVILEPSRRYFETQRYFDALRNSAMSHSDVRVGPVSASTIYLFDPSTPEERNLQDNLTLTQFQGAPSRFGTDVQEPDKTNTGTGSIRAVLKETNTMTRFCQARNSCARWSAPRLLLLLLGLPVVAQQLTVSAPLTADQVINRVAEMNELRAKALERYSSVRSYHLECHCLSHKKADMVVRADYQAPNKKEFTIVSESGSGTVRDRVFKKLLEAEQESMRSRESAAFRHNARRTIRFNSLSTRRPIRRILRARRPAAKQEQVSV